MQPLLLLHGAIGAAGQLEPLAKVLENQYEVHMLSFSGHGGHTFPAEPFSIPLFAADVLAYMEQHNISRTSIFGYSMGGYVGMYLAKHHPDKVDKVATLASKFHWDEVIAAKEVMMVNAGKIAEKLPPFAAVLQERHAPQDWKAVMERTGDMMLALGKDNTLAMEDYNDIQASALILLGDRDKMVSLEETVAVYKALPNAAMGVLPGTPHPIEQVDVEILASFLSRFF